MVDRNIYPDAATRDGIRHIEPKSGQLGTIRHCYPKTYYKESSLNGVIITNHGGGFNRGAGGHARPSDNISYSKQ